MSLTVVGAGLGRTGTSSLQDALGIPVPDIAFPHANTYEDFQKT
ncbi:hypothetical protein [Nocardioides bigeumensis]|jgi:hypothetical protein